MAQRDPVHYLQGPNDDLCGNQQCSSDYGDGCDDELDMFTDVIAALDLEKLPDLAQKTRRAQEPYRAQPDKLPVVGELMHGSYNIIYPIDFSDGIRWLVKVPINGTENKWDKLSAVAMTAEVNTMRLLKRETTTPLPEVFDFSATTDNPLNCPYMFISFIDGIPLQKVWYAKAKNDAEYMAIQTRRMTALEGIAKAMVQLDQYTSEVAGSPLFNADGSLSGVGPARTIDLDALLDRWYVKGDPSDDPIYAEHQVCGDVKEWYEFIPDLHPREVKYPKGIVQLLRWMINWLPEPMGFDHRCVLAHPDLDMQNIIVNENGELQGIIDWDGVCMVPRSMGNRSYPKWLTQDWNPFGYMYSEPTEEADPSTKQACCSGSDDSPSVLKDYRTIYRFLLTIFESNEEECFGEDTTRMSLISTNLFTAAQNPQCRVDIVVKLLEESFATLKTGKEFDLYYVPYHSGEGLIDEKSGIIMMFKEGFLNLLDKEL
ncbi:hypothetical protein B0T10DRAFT_558352 [Thelonectria olida]|uniref:Aminoglycoside phosphotransferase domain-containing protein n=1 Tax=Thelonectria olida TaxID=1576542 RepID=A0A9P9AS84_9HYPO|nr:hypothetical protein B0T10DRAFT_558352 [Thelonectria olida]